MVDVTAFQMGATTNTTTNLPTHYESNSQLPMVFNHSGEHDNYDGNNTRVVPYDDENEMKMLRVVSSSDNMGETPLSDGNTLFQPATANSNAASISDTISCLCGTKLIIKYGRSLVFPYFKYNIP